MNNLLIKATSNNRIEVVRTLIDSDYDLNETDERKRTALVISTAANYQEIAKLLLEAGCNPNVSDEFGQTALIYAIVNKNLEIVELLLKYGAEIDLKDFSGKTALDMARRKSFSWQFGTEITSIEFPCWWRKSEILKILERYKKIQDETNKRPQ